MRKLLDEIHYYAKLIRLIERSDEPDKGSVEYFRLKLNEKKKQLKEVIA